MTSLEDVVLFLQTRAAPCAIMMIGVPGSGKSYVAEVISDKTGVPILSSDKIRGELSGDENDQSVSGKAWSLLYERAADKLAQGESVIIDGTHNSKPGRVRDIKRYRASGALSVVGVWVDPHLSVSLQRNQSRDRVVPEFVVERMHANIDANRPAPHDGFAAVYQLV